MARPSPPSALQPDDAATAAIATRLAAAGEAVAGARDAVRQGGTIELAGLEAAVGEICRDIAALAPGAQRALKVPLMSLVDGLGALAETLGAAHGALARDLDQSAARQRAVSAYRGPGTRSPRG